MQQLMRVKCGAIRRLVGRSMIPLVVSLAWSASVLASPVSLAELRASGAAPLQAVTVGDGTGLLLASADRGPGGALSWWFPDANPDAPILQGRLQPLTTGAREWGVVADQERGVALVYWRGASRELGWVEIQAHGAPGDSGALALAGPRDRPAAMEVRVAHLAEGWLVASTAERAGGRDAASFQLNRVGAPSAEPVVVEGRLVDLVGRAGRAWALRWDEASGALELGALVAPRETRPSVAVERWTRLDTIAELGPWGVIINPIDEPIRSRPVPSSVLTPIDRPIDFEGRSSVIINPIEEPERPSSVGPHLALQPAGGAWEGFAAWRGDEGTASVAFFDAEGGTLVQALSEWPDAAQAWRVAGGSEWFAAQDGGADSLVRLSDRTLGGLEPGLEVASGRLLAAWETTSAIAVLTAAPRYGGGRDLAVPSKPIIPIGVTSRGEGGRTMAIPSKPVIPIGLVSAPGELVLLGLPGTPGEPIDFERLASIDLVELTEADGKASQLLDLRPAGDGAWLLRRVHADGRHQFALLSDLTAPMVDGWHDLPELVGSRSFPIKPPNEVLLRWVVLADGLREPSGRP